MSTDFDKVRASLIRVQSERQRTEVTDIPELVESIKSHGLLQPIVVTRELTLVAGERRLTACRVIDPEMLVLVRFIDTLDPMELQLLELEENIKRRDLKWQDKMRAIQKVHKMMKDRNERWTLNDTAKLINLSDANVGINLAVADSIDSGNTKLLQFKTMTEAHSTVQRETRRKLDNEMNSLLDNIATQAKAVASGPAIVSPEEVVKTEVPVDDASFSVADFHTFAGAYSGPKFNFLHCDFPYGINFDSSGQAGTKDGIWDSYEDTSDVYWALLQTLATHYKNLLHYSSHIMFWLSMKHYSTTVEFFEKYMPDLTVDHIPLIWYKSDNKGIIRNVEHTARNVGEYCLMLTRGDRKIIQPIANIYSAPTNKANAIHVSEKPIPMLKHFFRMFVDHNTEMLDPTCGGGTSIRAAQDMGASRMVGLDINEDYINAAAVALKRSRGLADITKLIPQGDN